ncbi:MAG: protocatechuate 3,4-dioxygenase subunit beta [Reyranellaceae bacterium]
MSETDRYLDLPDGVHPVPLTPAYGSTVKRAPMMPPVRLPQTLSELTGPALGGEYVRAPDCDLTRQHAGEPLGERIVVEGRVLDENGLPVREALVEMWQCNAAGRYAHAADQHDAPLDPNFTGNGRAVTDAEGRYRFVTVKPGAYPWRNHANAWRPAHLHFSLFGASLITRLVTQMYFPGDPLLPLDPIYNSVPDEKARQRLIAAFSLDSTVAEWALGYQFDIVLRGRKATPMES